MKLADALSGRAKSEGIQWLLLSATPRRVLRDQPKALLPDPNMLGPCRLRRVEPVNHQVVGNARASVLIGETHSTS